MKKPVSEVTTTTTTVGNIAIIPATDMKDDTPEPTDLRNNHHPTPHDESGLDSYPEEPSQDDDDHDDDEEEQNNSEANLK